MQSEYEDQFRVESYLPFIDPIIAKWFNSTYSGLTDPQRRAIPLIHEGRNVLVSSPTGTGKTLTGFLSIINELFILSRKGEIRDQIYAVYISPLKALANDIDKNLKKPLEEIYAVARAEGMKLPEIRVGVRSGDTSQKDRQKMLRKPPHILITTPESLALILSSPKFSQNLASAKYLILDEIHEISSTKRGSFLSLNMERLADKVNGNLVRIGLSATQAPIGEIAAYLVGNRDGKVRDVKIIEVDAKKFLDLKTITPVPDLTAVSQDVANERMYDILTDLINSHKTTLIFTNTRSSTEHVAVRLKARGVESIEAHHSSLGKDTRLEVENKLKNGELKCVITSTSLELGIDIGYIDLVVQIGSPKSVSKGLQRIGRSGHNVNDMSKGRFVVFDLDDLVECAVLTRAAYERQIDRVTIPKNSLDVLSQCLVGMAIEKVWKIDDAYELIRRSYSYASLSREDFMNVLDYLAGEIAENTIFPKIWIDKKEGVFGKKKSARMIFFMNVGTIPDESDYQVISERGKHLGQLSDKFVERLKAGDVFVLGARTYIFLHTARNRVMVKEATGVKPTVPSWTGELLPRSYDLGILIGKFREKVTDMLSRGEDAVRFIIENYRVDASGAESIISYVKAQAKFAIPTGDYMLLEGYIDEDRNYCAIFHVPLGRRVNDALSRAYALSLANEFGINARVSITDDGFMLSYQKEIPLQKIVEMIRSENFVEMVRRSISNSEVLKQRFRHCASRSLMILRKYKGFDISVARQQLRSDRVLKALEEIGNFPVVTEAYREIMDDMMDVPRAEEFVRNVIENKRYRILGYSPEPSPFSHGIILSGVSDIVLMEDRARLLRELQSKILEKIYGSSSITFLVNDRDMAESYFRSKVPRIIDDESFDRFLRHFLFIDPFRNKVNSPFPYAETGITDIVERFINEDRMVSAFIRSPEYTHPDYYPILTSLFRQNITVDDLEKRIMDLLADNEMTLSEIIRATGVADNAVKDSLLRLETGYMIRRKIRNGSTAYALNRFDSKQVSQEEALEKAIEILVGSLGPLTFDEISIRLPVDRDMLAKSLRKMVEQKIMVFENITPVFAKQYILASDLSNLLNFSKLNIVASRTYNIMQKIQDEREYFSRFGFCFDQMSIMIRGGMVSDRFPGEGILYGRFIKHQWVYASLDLVQALHSLRYYDFNQNVLSVLEKIDEYGCT
ncbi:MAG: ATP-dependent helicase, partial [Candidatus Thermoplasmatota archaeon]|nr:ATP-dependent helicase [Candidatus Thermoplasmatota archaeon]